MFKRKKSYPAVVAEAQRAATEWNWTPVVYRNLSYRWWNCIPRYGYCNKIDFDRIIKTGKHPLIQLLLILPNGTVAQ